MQGSLIDIVKSMFKRDLNKLHKEIDAYEMEEQMWVVEKSISNSAGNLCLHLIGNLHAFIGAELGQTGYIRKRDLEFSQKNVSKADLLKMIADTSTMIEEALDKLTLEKLNEDYPLMVFREKMSTAFFLVHLTTHLTYHLGQINYHRRLI